MLKQFLYHILARKWWNSCQHMEYSASQRIKIAADIDIARVAGLLRADVIKRA